MPGTDKAAPSTTAVTDQEALDFHSRGRAGKLEISPTKPMATQRDLSLAYSPGVAVPVKAIAEDPSRAFDYTTRGNMVAVITNGTAILGLGNLGALASKPVMEGKSVLFKRFADVDSIDLEVDTEDADEFINCVRFLGPSFGGINLEDIKAPECFIIEQRLREIMDIPVFHDDQHGTAIIAAAGLINALHLTGRDLKTTKLVCNGAGAAAIACVELIKSMGFAPQNIILCDTKGVIHKDRTEGMNQWKSAHAVVTDRRTLKEALDGADVFFGLSVKGALTEEMVASIEASGAEMVTVAIRRLDLDNSDRKTILDYIDWTSYVILPNTAGAKTPEEAVTTARLAREMGLSDWVKLEVIPDPTYLLPDPIGTLKAAEILIKDGFTVLPYIHADPVLARQLEELGCATVMPLGSGLGAFLGGLFYDVRGTYDVAIWSNVVLLILATFLVLSIGERRTAEVERATA